MTSTPPPVPIFDGHNDALLRLYRRGGADAARAFLDGEDKGQLDLPKAQAGGFAGGLFAVFVPPARREAAANTNSPAASSANATSTAADAPSQGAEAAPLGRSTDLGAPLPPPMELEPAQKVTFGMVSLLLRIERESQGRVRICRTLAEIKRCLKDGVIAAVLHIEGAEAIDANFDTLDVLHQAGLRSLGPVWSRPNAFGHGVPFRLSSPDTGPGLTDLGKELVRACNRLRILIDLSHLNERGFWDVAGLSDAPLVATHSNAHTLSPHARNLTDAQLAAIGNSGGFAGVNFAVSFLREDGKMDANTPLDLVLDHVEYLIKHVGEDGVGFGSDFDGARIPAGLGTAAGLQNLVALMRTRGYGERLIAKVCHRNWLRILEKTWGG